MRERFGTLTDGTVESDARTIGETGLVVIDRSPTGVLFGRLSRFPAYGTEARHAAPDGTERDAAVRVELTAEELVRRLCGLRSPVSGLRPQGSDAPAGWELWGSGRSKQSAVFDHQALIDVAQGCQVRFSASTIGLRGLQLRPELFHFGIACGRCSEAGASTGTEVLDTQNTKLSLGLLEVLLQSRVLLQEHTILYLQRGLSAG
ncbi:hypothetical protein ACFRAO_34325 [Streptomyces sp. NPDC056656]|uniref:hypothetical protein n=1 Tax=Streptomyces sp. NPDC056656 TaxID=3345895 RepID=UPI0036A68E37